MPITYNTYTLLREELSRYHTSYIRYLCYEESVIALPGIHIVALLIILLRVKGYHVITHNTH